MWTVVGLVSLAGASPGTLQPPEEIVVWGDPFARWQQRWWVETEFKLPRPLVLNADQNHEIPTNAMVARAVLDCGKGPVLGPHAIEASCRIESISLQVATFKQTQGSLETLSETVGKLTGALIQVQVTDDGRVTNVDLEGIKTHNRRENQGVETLRQIASRIILPFHLGMPAGARPGGSWPEYGSRLLTLPDPQAPRGSSRIMHTMSDYEGYWLIQSIGEATMSIQAVPDIGLDLGDGFMKIEPGWLDHYITTMHGIGIIDPSTGILTERVWAIVGQASASSVSALATGGYSHQGSLRMLGQDEEATVGASMLTAPPGQSADGLPPWTPLPTRD